MNLLSHLIKFFRGFFSWFFVLGVYCLISGLILKAIDFGALMELGCLFAPFYYLPLAYSVVEPLRALRHGEIVMAVGIVSAYLFNILAFFLITILSYYLPFTPIPFDRVISAFLGIPFFVTLLLGIG